MGLPCINPSCPEPAESDSKWHASKRFGLCRHCRFLVDYKCIPTGGFIPRGSLNILARELKKHIKPTQSDTQAALRFARGPRHRVGPWSERPTYSQNVLWAPRSMGTTRRLPQLLVGRRAPPTVINLLASYIHYQLARQVLGTGHQYGLFLAGATFAARRSLMRPKVGELAKYKGSKIKANHRLTSTDFTILGRHAVKAAGILGIAKGHSTWITVNYLQGIESGRFNRPIIVDPDTRLTTGPGDHPLDIWLPRVIYHAPQYQRRIRRSSGKLHGDGHYPHELDVPPYERPDLNQIRYDSQKLQTSPAPSTAWLFPD